MDPGTVVVDPRPLTEPELALVGRLLDHALDPDAAARFRAGLPALRVIARCACGCPSLFFAPPPAAGAARDMVADVYGTTPEGYAVGLMLWAVGGGARVPGRLAARRLAAVRAARGQHGHPRVAARP